MPTNNQVPGKPSGSSSLSPVDKALTSTSNVQTVSLSHTAASPLSVKYQEKTQWLQTGMREYLPIQKPLNILTKQILQFDQSIQNNLPPTIKAQLNQLVTSIHQVAQKPLLDAQNVDAAKLIKHLQQSGVQLEATLKQLTPSFNHSQVLTQTQTSAKPEGGSTQSLPTVISVNQTKPRPLDVSQQNQTVEKPTTQNQFAHTQNTSTKLTAGEALFSKNTASSHTSAPLSTQSTLDSVKPQKPLSENDIQRLKESLKVDDKADLLRLHTAATDTLAQLKAGNIQLNPQLKDTLANIIFSLFKRSVTPSGPEKTSKVTLENAINALQQQVRSGIARISSLQLLQLNRAGDGASGQAITTELPIRFGEHIIPLFLSIQEKPHEEKAKNNSGEKKPVSKTNSWNVFMELDIDGFGYFSTEIKLTDGKLKTNFWIENTELESEAKKQFTILKDTLTQSGVSVEEVNFSRGTPPNRETGFNHALVDITT